MIGGVVGVRAFYRVLVPCVVDDGGDGECRVEGLRKGEGVGSVVWVVGVLVSFSSVVCLSVFWFVDGRGI